MRLAPVNEALSAISGPRQPQHEGASMRAFRGALELLLAIPHCPIYLFGESGVGKTYFAREIHARRRGALRPFVDVPLTALSDALALAELFGSVKGAFTGAIDRAGRLEDAHSGTVFLDEIAKSPLSVQAGLLRFLESGEFTRLGSSKTLRVDAHVVVASSGEPEVQVHDGSLLQDLLERFVGATLRIPPLRERRCELPHLLTQALHRAAQLANLNPPELTPTLRARMLSASWPANMRGLNRAAQLIVAHTGRGGVADEDVLSPLLLACMGHERAGLADMSDSEIMKALVAAGGNRSALARLLGVDLRTVQRRLGRLQRGTS